MEYYLNVPVEYYRRHYWLWIFYIERQAFNFELKMKKAFNSELILISRFYEIELHLDRKKCLARKLGNQFLIPTLNFLLSYLRILYNFPFLNASTLYWLFFIVGAIRIIFMQIEIDRLKQSDNVVQVCLIKIKFWKQTFLLNNIKIYK